MNLSIRISTFLATVAMVFASAGMALAANGDLVRNATDSAVYYVNDGQRFAFPNLKTYETWYPDFSTVKFISDGELASYQLAANVCYRPGVKLVKIDTDPKVYAVDKGCVLHWVTTEAVASGLYGVHWNAMVHDIPVEFFTNYKIGADLNESANFSVSAAQDGAKPSDRPPASLFDVRRVADIQQIGAALLLHAVDLGEYPIASNIILGTSTSATLTEKAGFTAAGAGSGTVYIQNVPVAPPAEGSCTAAQNNYYYNSDGETYTLSFCLASAVGNYTAGVNVIRSN